MKTHSVLTVYQSPDELSPVLMETTKGQTIYVLKESGEFTRIRCKREGVVISGYVLTTDLYEGIEQAAIKPETKPVAKKARPTRDIASKSEPIALGIGAGTAQWSEPSRSFTGTDQVAYITSVYKSQTTPFFLYAQFQTYDFWRFTLGYRPIHFTGTLQPKIVGATSGPVTIQYSALSASLERCWNLLPWKPFYLGISVDIARAMSMQVEYNQQNLQGDTGLPMFYGASVVAGLQFALGRDYSLIGQGKVGQYLSQSLKIFAVEASGGILMWF